MLADIQAELSSYGATLVAISKTKSVEEIQRIYDLGLRHFGENRTQELIEKSHQLPADITWHMVGHLQSKKVKEIAGIVHWIHSVDSAKLMDEIEKRAAAAQREISLLVQVKIAEESTKYGLQDRASIDQFFESASKARYRYAKIRGLMGMASFVNDSHQIRDEFRKLRNLFEEVKHRYYSRDACFSELSMGMSGDYKIALEEGSTMVRIGTLIFGAR